MVVHSYQKHTIIFLHIPKASGSTLHRIIEQQYPPVVIYTIDGLNVVESTNEFKSLPQEQRQKIKVLKGHMSFGLHEYLARPSTYITILREPVERVISQYYYICHNPKHRLHAHVKGQNLSLSEYVSSGITTAVDNSQTRMLAAIDKSIVKFGQTPTEALDIAKQNLKIYFSVVGLTEKFDETLILLKKKFGWRLPFYVRENVTKNRQLKENIPPEAIEIIQHYNLLDIQLYHYAQQIFEQQLTQYAGNFEAELKLFRLINQQYGKVYPIYQSTLHKSQSLIKK
ncbi:sulfotransferase family 2 domain-containing protein [Chroogloeocystis siderophila]|jgi:hypothetical protein|uniref:Sulfotransferase family protein n=1 Tax=Chroogloeocystis siderophila 5.2 s.c.1 TaxID=247279 RepID=A0A1U7HQ88_9CHRO|nr:sulfotransferase family 2 domain-containing protein [Chroogloeocystis siderophila]OKH25729.1 hypothetical protein NIES1031_11990 [Chroogloeocystis siderophila 5.2 s.c.1]